MEIPADPSLSSKPNTSGQDPRSPRQGQPQGYGPVVLWDLGCCLAKCTFGILAVTSLCPDPADLELSLGLPPILPRKLQAFCPSPGGMVTFPSPRPLLPAGPAADASVVTIRMEPGRALASQEAPREVAAGNSHP